MLKQPLMKWILATGLLIGISAPAADVLKGKDIVAAGNIQTLSGSIRTEGNHNCFLVTDEQTYELHLGPEGYRESKNFTLKSGQPAEIRGFVYEGHLAPITIQTADASIALRTEEGKSLWAGTKYSRTATKQE